MLPIPEVTDVDVVFATRPHGLPDWDDIPDEFREGSGDARFWHHVVDTLFFNGGKLSDFGLKPKAGVDSNKAHRALRCCLTSWEPKHEHKTAGVAYMLSEWFEQESS